MFWRLPRIAGPRRCCRGVAEYLWDGSYSGWVGVGTDVLQDISGPVAVGKPSLVYYRGLSWTANNALRTALMASCPGFGVESKPISVATGGRWHGGCLA